MTSWGMRQALNPAVLERNRDWGPLILRVFIGFVLVYGTQDNVFHTARMLEFRDFLAGNGFPVPLLSAYVSAWAQFVCGLLIIVGFATRAAAAIMIVNFIVALLMVHTALPFSANIAPLSMLFGNVFLLLYGPGILSVEGRVGQSSGFPLFKGRAQTN
jgi:putative oxidoreductase